MILTGLFCVALIDAFVIVVILTTMNDSFVQFSTGFVIGLVTAFCFGVFNDVAILMFHEVFAEVIGLVLGTFTASLAVGLLLSAIVLVFFSMELKSAFKLGLMFSAYRIVFQMLTLCVPRLFMS